MLLPATNAAAQIQGEGVVMTRNYWLAWGATALVALSIGAAIGASIERAWGCGCGCPECPKCEERPECPTPETNPSEEAVEYPFDCSYIEKVASAECKPFYHSSGEPWCRCNGGWLNSVDGYETWSQPLNDNNGIAPALACLQSLAECETPLISVCGDREDLPDALCIRFKADPDSFVVQLSFHVIGEGWEATPEWTERGERFDPDMGMHLKRGDRFFLHHGGGKPYFDDMRRAQSREGPITYRFSPRTDGLLDVLVCGELDWNEIRVPGIVEWEPGEEEGDEALERSSGEM